MSIHVFLSLGAGNLSAGFERINFRIEIDGQLQAQKYGSLSGNWELQNLHYRWQFHYAAYYENCLDSLRGNDGSIELDSTGIEGFSVTSFEETTIELAREMCQWLDCCSFQAIGTHLQTTLAQRDRSTPAEQVIIVIESEDDRIYRLPWHCWSAIADCQYAEITFSLNTYQRQTSTSHRTKPRILAVFGDRTGIDTAADAKFIQQLRADLVTLTEPSIAQLRRQLDDRDGWDLLFFAGHSSDLNVDAIHLNPTESVTLTDLSHALKSAIGRGLKLAIFNCCSGLGLASSLALLDLPTAIVMREAIPNRVAQDFLQTFLHSFESGNSLLVAVAAARRQLQSIESDFPCATWLPVVFWNPTVELPTWRSFYPQPPARIQLWQLGAIILATTAAIWGVRSQGYLEPIELAAYDLAMNSRPIVEPPDERILIIGVERDKPLSDRVLFQALTKIQQYHPQAIGIDIYRDIPFGEGHRDLTTLLQQQPLISSCLMSGNSRKFPGVAAPRGVEPARVGFSNFSLDRDGILRRQLLGMAPVDPGCTTDRALSLSLALKYLNIATANESDNGNVNIGTHEVAVLGSSVGAYRSTNARDNLRGFQVMLNYRNNPQVAPELSLDDLFSDSPQSLRTKIAGKAILIGYVGQGSGDTFRLATMRQTPGVMIHAQMTSNLLSHILDERALITTWTDLGEFSWILLWGTVGGAIWWRFSGTQLWLAGTGAIVVVVAICGVYLNTRSVWIPLIPAEMAAILTPLVAMGVTRCQLKPVQSQSKCDRSPK